MGWAQKEQHVGVRETWVLLQWPGSDAQAGMIPL